MEKEMYNVISNTAQKKVAVLIDPDKQDPATAGKKAYAAQKSGAEYIFIGGSLVADVLDETIRQVQDSIHLPLYLFPGNLMQLSRFADAVLLLSLISGRNADLLIGNHVLAAPYFKKHKIETISTSYILIDGGKPTSVQYLSNTQPLPADKPDLAAATALAGELIGHQLVYLEAGSGALNPVSPEIIRAVRKTVSSPLIVGGGIRTKEALQNAFTAGADVVVIGTAFEENQNILREIL